MTAEQLTTTSRRRCYLVRHGHVDYFDLQGKPLDPRAVQLSRRGAQQAWQLGQVMQDLPIDRVLCSDYPRARQTLDLLLVGREAPIDFLPALREIRAGRLRDIPAAGLRDTITGAYRSAAKPGATFLGGERWDEFQGRILAQFFDLLAEPAWESALIVSHDAVNRVLLAWAAGVGLKGIAAFEQDTACLNILDVDSLGPEVLGGIIRTLNFTPYNPHKTGLSGTVLENMFSALKPAALES
ncbi:histidine phosphatase family protein [Pseudomonas sp. BN415]|jgi:probable phosphoglycerate mutase|uniref:histidine phosphatase family protein n=1 Tax=Pseudomonas sp. BN415 TaxID=2567889 RepID=UPI002457F318|nr:histidine phosphatase family protein [Pseudomonas sp. BN415]MDH4582814.1 histidine phosphatase family protein [Pseudomonas sp. BN415]